MDLVSFVLSDCNDFRNHCDVNTRQSYSRAFALVSLHYFEEHFFPTSLVHFSHGILLWPVEMSVMVARHAISHPRSFLCLNFRQVVESLLYRTASNMAE